VVGEEFCVVVVVDRGVDFSVFKPQPDVETMSANTHHFIWSSWRLLGFSVLYCPAGCQIYHVRRYAF